MNRNALAEAAIALLVFGLSSIWASLYWTRSLQAGRQPSFYQVYYEPAVMVACGHGFRRADPPVPAVMDFLLLKRDALSCSDIPPATVFTDRNLYQSAWRYLLYTVAMAWRVLGISWSGLGPLLGVLFGATIAAAYGIFRVGMSRTASVVCAAALAISAVHLQNLPHLRDYAKAPFALVLMLLIFRLVSGHATWRRVVGIAAAYGAILGVGYGFRTDFLVDIPLFLVTLVVFLDDGPSRHLPMKLVAAVVCMAAFAVTAWPIITTVRERGGCQWHAALLGLTDEPTDALMVTRASYSFGHDFSDAWAYASSSAFAARIDPAIGHVEYCSHEYDQVTGRYLAEIGATFPGDVVTRTLASVVQILQVPFRWFDQPLPGWWNALYRVRLLILKPLRGSGVVFAAVALVALAAVSPRLGLFGVFVLLYVGGYPMLQFDVRHYFHLEFLTWWAAGFLLDHVIAEWRSSNGSTSSTLAQIRARYEWARGGRTIGAAALAVVAVLWIARGVQQVSATRLFQRYVDAPKASLAIGRRLDSLNRLSMGRDSALDPYPADLLEIDLDVPRCGASPSIAFHYDPPFDGFSHVISPGDRERGGESTRVFEPVYAGFAGVRFSDVTPDCLRGVYRLKEPERFHLLLETVLPPTWRHQAMFERMFPLRWRL